MVLRRIEVLEKRLFVATTARHYILHQGQFQLSRRIPQYRQAFYSLKAPIEVGCVARNAFRLRQNSLPVPRDPDAAGTWGSSASIVTDITG